MEWLNYHHLHYFHMIAQEGSLTKAASRLRLTHSTLSAQLKSLEEFLGHPLFDRRGKRLALTPFGAEIAHYAADIFRLGGELVDVARGRSSAKRTVLRVGVAGTLPTTIIHRLISPALENGQDAAVSVVQAPLSELLLLLAAHHVQMVLCDTPAPRGQAVRVHTHFLGASPILLYAACDIADKVREGFPDSLNGAPFLFPAAGSGLRSAMERWLADRGISVHTAGEIEGADLLRKFGIRGLGVFPIREALQKEAEDMGRVQCLGEMKGVSEKYYAVSLERRMADPLLAAIIKSGRRNLASGDRYGTTPETRDGQA